RFCQEVTGVNQWAITLQMKIGARSVDELGVYLKGIDKYRPDLRVEVRNRQARARSFFNHSLTRLFVKDIVMGKKSRCPRRGFLRIYRIEDLPRRCRTAIRETPFIEEEGIIFELIIRHASADSKPGTIITIKHAVINTIIDVIKCFIPIMRQRNPDITIVEDIPTENPILRRILDPIPLGIAVRLRSFGKNIVLNQIVLGGVKRVGHGVRILPAIIALTNFLSRIG